MNTTVLTWFIIGIVFMLAEFAVPGFVIFFFGIGALVTAVLSYFEITNTLPLQIAVFIISSALTLYIFRIKGKKYFRGDVSENLHGHGLPNHVKGEKAIVINTINPKGIGGKVEYHGTIWEAEADETIEKGTVVEIMERHNLVLKVRVIE